MNEERLEIYRLVRKLLYWGGREVNGIEYVKGFRESFVF